MYMKYSNGYIPKIEYWVNKLLNASTPIEQATALSKVRYFQNRHKEVYGEIVTMDGHVVETNPQPKDVIAGVDFSESIAQLNNLSNSWK
jgi:hypothetical protein